MSRTQIDTAIRLCVVVSMLFTQLWPALAFASPAGQQDEPTVTATPTETVEPTATETATVEVTEKATETTPPTETATVTALPTETVETGEPTATEILVETPTVTSTEVTSPTETATPLTPSPPLEASPTLTYTTGPPAPTATETATLTPTPTVTPTVIVIIPTATLTPTAILTPTATPSVTTIAPSLLMSVEPPTAAAGEQVTATLTISNPGSGSIDNLVLSTILPAELSYEQPLGSVAASYAPQARQLSWQIPSLGGQSQLSLGYLARLSQSVTSGSLVLVGELFEPKTGTSTLAEAQYIDSVMFGVPI